MRPVRDDVPGEHLFDGRMARKGHSLNQTCFSFNDLVKAVGTQGIERIGWLAARAALGDPVRERHRNHRIPISNTASGLMRFETA